MVESPILTNDLSKYIARAEEKRASENGSYRSPQEWSFIGVRRLKSNVLGLCGQETVKSLDELSKIVCTLFNVDSSARAKKLIRSAYGEDLHLSSEKALRLNSVAEGVRIKLYDGIIPGAASGFYY